MTFSILARDEVSGAIGGAAATGSLCVGGWVLRGDVRAGMSASQGKSPSTLWGEDVLALMRNGATASEAASDVTARDAGRAQRQLSVLGLQGPGAVHSGGENGPVVAENLFDGGVAAGNILTGPEVIDALVSSYLGAEGTFAERLLQGLRAADSKGGDARGLQSAALLILSPKAPPLSLRVDWSPDPLGDLAHLLERATSGYYAEWSTQVPVLDDPERTLT